MKKMMLSMVPDGILDGLCFDMELVSLSGVYGKLSESILSQSLIQEAWIKDVSCPSEVR